MYLVVYRNRSPRGVSALRSDSRFYSWLLNSGASIFRVVISSEDDPGRFQQLTVISEDDRDGSFIRYTGEWRDVPKDVDPLLTGRSAASV